MDQNKPIVLDTFTPRPYQLELCNAFESGKWKRFVICGHRRMGKDICAFNLMIRAALRKPGVYYYIFPTYSQAKKVIWDSLTNDGKKFLDFIPPQLIASSNSQEMKIRLTNNSLIQLVGSDNVDCFDGQTEILTQEGWKFFKDLSDYDKVATLKDNYMVFEKPLNKMVYDYTGKMYSINSKCMDMLVTPNHRFYVRSSKGVYKFKEISDPTIRHDSIPSTCKWVGEHKQYFVFPVTTSEYICGKGRKVFKEYSRRINMDKFVALLGIFLSEGSTYSNHKTYKISISQVKELVRNKIRILLEDIGINYTESKDGFAFEDKQMYLYFSQFGTQEHRFIPKEIKNLSPYFLNILFEWLLLGDGYKNAESTWYYSCSKQLIDDVQEIILKLGYSGNIIIKAHKGDAGGLIRGRQITYKRDLYAIRVRTSQFKRLCSSKKRYISTQNYTGKVYCVSVSSGVIKVRRNGKECWSGNSLVGTNPVGIVFSEYALQDPRAYQFLRPIILINDGWTLFISTPRGKNHFYDLYNIAGNHPEEWYSLLLTIDDTGILTRKQMQDEIDEGLVSEDLAYQEYLCSFTMGIEGAYYAKYMDKMRLESRIGEVPWEAGFAVHTAWDLGVRDSTTIIFFQHVGTAVRIIDCYENSKLGLEHYIKVVNSKPYIYGKHIAPHDIKVKELGTGMTRLEKARQLGIRFTVAPSITIIDGIESVRSMISKVWIDESKCTNLIKALENYRQEWDSKRKIYKTSPLHNEASHWADSMRYLAITLPRTKDGNSTKEELDARYYQAMYGHDAQFAAPFRKPR